MAVPYTFGSATTSIPLSQLDSNFATTITLGNTAIQLGNTVTTLNNMTLANVTISSGTSSIVPTSIANGTSNVTIASSGGAIAMATNGATAITVDTSQKVGIGSASPGAKLDVNGQALIGTTGNNAIAINSSGANYGFISNPSTGVFALGYGATIGTLGTSVATWNSSDNFAFNSGYGSVATAYGCRAWINFNGTGTPAIRGSGNISSITDNGVGDYSLNFTNAMPDSNYAFVGATAWTPGIASAIIGSNTGSSYLNTSYLRFYVLGNTSDNVIDETTVMVSIFR
jgi:hypothetical protein